MKEFTNLEDVMREGMADRIRLARKTTLTRVILMDENFTCHTPEGTVQGKAGDYLAIGVGDECYPIGNEYFENSYEFVDETPKEATVLSRTEVNFATGEQNENVQVLYVTGVFSEGCPEPNEDNTHESQGEADLDLQYQSQRSEDLWAAWEYPSKFVMAFGYKGYVYVY